MEAKIVAFVVAQDERFPDRGQEFDSVRAAIDSKLRGWYLKKLELVSGPAVGQILWHVGVHGFYRVGMKLEGGRCLCGAAVWRVRREEEAEFECEDCRLEKTTDSYPSDDE